ncbi:hypothetical protein BGZ94_005861 [Podila epigama]|nr:hypothetical protein BGZ94_005861 [Podila epigama]
MNTGNKGAMASASDNARFRNHLDLPEDRSQGAFRPQGQSRNPADGRSPGMSDIDLDDDDEGRKFSLKDDENTPTKKKKRMPRFFRKSSVRVHMDRNIKMVGTGRNAQFSNERLYLHWIRFGVLQSSIAVLLLSFGTGLASWIGVGTLVVSMLTLTYATTLYHKRHLWMVAKRQDVAYFALKVPTLICISLFVLYGANFGLSMYYGPDVRSKAPWTQYNENIGHAF